MLIDDLKEIQERRGFLPSEEGHAYTGRNRTPLYQIQALASFYPHSRMEPPPRVEVRVCTDLACHLRGAGELHRRLAALGGSADDIQVHPCSCLGQCDRAPALLVNEVPAAHADTLDLQALIASPPAL